MKRKTINTHLTLECRLYIEEGLNEGKTITQISNELNRDSSNISREIAKHKIPFFPSSFNNYNACLKISTCNYKYFECYKSCKNIEINLCDKLISSPHVCNGCPTKSGCRHVKYYYKAKDANCEYLNLLKSSRNSLHYTPIELNILNNDFKNLVYSNRSIYHSLIIINNRGFKFNERSIYRQIKNNRLELKSTDLPRYRKINGKSTRDKSYKSHNVKGHTYEDYLKYKEEHDKANEIQMDTVEGIQGSNEPVMLTLQIVDIDFLFIFKIKRQTFDEVTSKINELKNILTDEKFNLLFELWLTDNGHEFNNVEKITSLFPSTNIF